MEEGLEKIAERNLMAWTTQHEGKIYATESHEESSEQLGMCILNDWGPLVLKMLLVVNYSKLYLNAF